MATRQETHQHTAAGHYIWKSWLHHSELRKYHIRCSFVDLIPLDMRVSICGEYAHCSRVVQSRDEKKMCACSPDVQSTDNAGFLSFV